MADSGTRQIIDAADVLWVRILLEWVLEAVFEVSRTHAEELL